MFEQQHLAAVTCCADPRASVNAHADVPLATNQRLAPCGSPSARAGERRRPARARLRAPPLRRDCSRDRIARARRKTQRSTRLPGCRSRGRSYCSIAARSSTGVGREDAVVSFAQLFRRPRRPLDVAEEKRDRTGRTFGHLQPLTISASRRKQKGEPRAGSEAPAEESSPLRRACVRPGGRRATPSA